MRHFAIKLNKLKFAIKLNKLKTAPTYLAEEKHITPYTQLPQYIRRFESREEAAKHLWNEHEVIVDMRHELK